LWENPKTGRKGYSPVCSNEWVRGICQKPRVKCGKCSHRAFLPVTDQVVLDHLQGRHVIGVYPLLPDEGCRLLAADFDGASWQEDVTAFVATCQRIGVPPAIERSRSGKGAHAWFFFSGPVAASVARQMGCHLLTETMSYRHQFGMASYDRLFPNQDTMPAGGFGNLIALPLQQNPRKEGNTVFVAPPGTGKTVVGAYLTAARGRNTLVLVHRKPILDQWVARLSSFLGVDPKTIGRIGGGKNLPTGRLDVAMIQSLVRKGNVNDLVARYGHVIVDECHHLPAVSFERVLAEVKGRYVTGLTATPYRRDGHQPIIHMQLGPVRFESSRQRHAAEQTFEQRLILRETNFGVGDLGPDAGIQEIYAVLAANEDRNMLIFDDVLRSLEEGRSPILLTERKDHLDLLAECFRKFTCHLVVLKGGMTVRKRKEVMERLASIPCDEERLILATGRYIGEGFDDVRLDTLFLALPVSWKGTLVQYAGRLHRQRPEKKEAQIYDYVDRNVPMLARMFEKRMKGYEALGYSKTSGEEPSWSGYLPQSRQPNSPASNRHRQSRSGGVYPPGESFSSGRLTLSKSIRAASEIPFEVDLVEKKPFPTGAKGPRRK
jgi:superfamily II DNA or RNA helicase